MALIADQHIKDVVRRCNLRVWVFVIMSGMYKIQLYVSIVSRDMDFYPLKVYTNDSLWYKLSTIMNDN